MTLARRLVGPGRRSTIDESLFELAPYPVPRRRAPQPRTRIVKEMCHITDDQRDDLNELAATLAGGEYCKAELVRTAIAWLLQQEEGALIRRLEGQRDEEERGRYGFGNRPI